MIVFKGKYIEKKDDFYLEETANLTIGKSYKVLKENMTKPFSTYIIIDDNGSVCTTSAKYFWTLAECREMKLNDLGI